MARLARLAARQGRAEEARDRLAAGASLALVLGTSAPKVSVVAALAVVLAAAGEGDAARAAVALGLAMPALNEADRNELDLVAAELPEGGSSMMPALPVDELLQRLVSEAASGHAALVATLRGSA